MNISRPFLLLLGALPFIEILLLIRVIGMVGFIATLGLLLLAAATGMTIIRTQGMSALIRSQQALARGELPAHEVVNSGIAVLGGVLLVIPGFLSDLLALPCLIPPIRGRLAEHLINSRFSVPATQPRPTGDSVIEGEFRRED
jgi:UPF0716 protein FxsA